MTKILIRRILYKDIIEDLAGNVLAWLVSKLLGWWACWNVLGRMLIAWNKVCWHWLGLGDYCVPYIEICSNRPAILASVIPCQVISKQSSRQRREEECLYLQFKCLLRLLEIGWTQPTHSPNIRYLIPITKPCVFTLQVFWFEDCCQDPCQAISSHYIDWHSNWMFFVDITIISRDPAVFPFIWNAVISSFR